MLRYSLKKKRWKKKEKITLLCLLREQNENGGDEDEERWRVKEANIHDKSWTINLSHWFVTI